VVDTVAYGTTIEEGGDSYTKSNKILNFNKKSVPFRGLKCNEILLECNFMIRRAMLTPIPVPFGFAVK
jgi:hypothetical protein